MVEAFTGLRSHGRVPAACSSTGLLVPVPVKVARKCKNNITKTVMNEEQQQPTSQKPPGGSPKESTIAGSFC